MNIFRDKTYCKICTEKNDIIRYNPFYQAPHFTNDGLLDDEPINYISSIQTASDIFEKCQSYQINHLNTKTINENIQNYFSTCFLNIDGNQTNFDNFATQLLSIQHQFSAIGLAETNTDPVNGNMYQLNGYSSIYQSRFVCQSNNKQKSKGSGVCLYLCNALNLNKMNDISLCKEHIETLFVTITNMPEPIVVGVIYRPPNSSLTDFNNEYEEILRKLDGKKAYLLGDFNVNILNISTPQEESFEEIIYTRGFIPTISIPTHQMPNCSKTCIDNIHTNDIDGSTLTGVILDKLSHHHPIFLIKKFSELEGATPGDQSGKITIHYDYSNANLEKLCSEIESDIDRFYHQCDTFDSFLTLFHEKIDQSCKLATPKTTKRNSITNPWITQGLINSVEKKARLYFEWCKSCTAELPDGDPKLHLRYLEYRKFLKTAIKMAKASYYANKFEKFKSNSKMTWKIINELRGMEKTHTKDNFVIDGNRVTCRRIIANKFNEYFTSLASNLNEQVSTQSNPLDSFANFMPTSVDGSLYFEDTNPEEICEIIMDLQNGKASDIPITVLKRPARLIAPVLSGLYNNCIHQGQFPSVFKVGKVTPIYKKDNKECIENYRPVSILPIFGKIFEKIIYTRLYNYLTSKGILRDEQFGFRKSHSTVHALHRSVESITKELRNGRHVIGIFIDLSKAFDSLDRNILLRKLENYGIRGKVHSLLASYLNERKQYVSFNNTTSETLGIEYGVPQGSILGPLLFLLYINDIINCYSNSETTFSLYADDTNLFITGPSKESTYLKANEVLEHVSNYMRCNLLHINMSKCCFIHFKPQFEFDETCARVRPFAKEDDKSRAIFINGKKICKVSSTKFLGIVIDEQLNWTAHIEYLRKKIRSIIGALCRIRHSVPSDLYLKIYNSLFESHLTYGISVWGVAIKNQSDDKLFIAQKHCIRILFGDLNAYLDKQSTCARSRPFGQQKLGVKFYQKEHTKPIFNRLQILTVQALYKYFSITEIFKILKLRCPYSLFSSIATSKREASNTIILPEKSNTFFFRASQLWNSVQKRIILSNEGLSESINVVKLRTKSTLLEAQSLGIRDQWKPHNF